jgi:hypothetical protein
MPATRAKVEEQGARVILQTPSGHIAELQWAIVQPPSWERLRSEPGWSKVTEFAEYVIAARLLTG